MKYATLKLLLIFIQTIRVLLRFFVIFLLILFLIQFVADINKYTTLALIKNFGQPLIDPLVVQIKLLMPYKYNGIDLSTVIIGLFTIFLSSLLNRFQYRIERILNEKKYGDWRRQAASVLSRERVAELDTKFIDLQTGKGKSSSRKEILKEFAKLRTQLDNMGQQLAFLAIDVVDSTGMKKDEDKYLAAYDFDRYNEIVSECLKEHGVVKFAMTPDGIMSCFRTVDDAVSAGQNLLDRLKIFNAEEKKIKRNFQIRCGINAGFVYMDEDVPLEQISDRVIDIAGHMQKYAKPDCINIAASAIEPLKVRGGFSETTDVIDDQKVYEWSSTKQ